jgi:hypothetical protein
VTAAGALLASIVCHCFLPFAACPCVYMYLYMYMCVCVSVCVYVCVCTCGFCYTCTFVCIIRASDPKSKKPVHIHAHTHTHTQTSIIASRFCHNVSPFYFLRSMRRCEHRLYKMPRLLTTQLITAFDRGACGATRTRNVWTLLTLCLRIVDTQMVVVLHSQPGCQLFPQ